MLIQIFSSNRWNAGSCNYYIIFRALMVFVSVIIATLFLSFNPAFATEEQNSLSIQIDTNLLEMEILPIASGAFHKTDDETILVQTDNDSGYTLSVIATDSSSLVDSNDNEIESITSSISESVFSTNSAYNNQWGFKPSKYVVSNAGVNTVISNSDYLPVPTSSGFILDITNSANAVNNSYTISFGARIDSTQPTGVYEYTYVIQAVANSIMYNITYDPSTNDTVGSMPSPNPQIVPVDSGTTTITLSRAIPTLEDMAFSGWCSVTPTLNQSTNDYECSGTTYQPGGQYTINQAGGTNITLYAIWVNDPFPMVWTQMGACEFHAATNGNITGTECQDYTSDKFIDTGIALYSTTNSAKDYEVHFTIDHYVPSENNGLADQQQTFVSDKLSSSVTSSPYDGKSPGMIVRRSGDDIQIRSTSGHNNSSSSEIFVPSSTSTDISIYRIDGIIYASINHGALQQIQNVSSFDQQFGLNTWFGAYPGDDCTGNTTNGVCTNAIRYIEATLSNMYIKLGDFSKTMHTITFSANGGTPVTTTYKVIDGDVLGPLPTNVTRTGYVLMYWYSATGGNNIASPDTQPHGDITYYASWLKEAAQATISNSSITIPVSGTATINVTNSAELEDYTFSSGDTSVATVDSATGLVTGIGTGTTTITLTGTKSGTTKTINVTVSDSMVRVSFTTGQGSSVDPIDVEIGDTISELPISIRSGYTIEGWYTGADGTGTKLTTSLPINNNMTFIANWIVTTNVCRLADPTALHEETCSRTSGGCRTSNLYLNGEKITYGKVPQDSNLVAGIAYTCDINANNEYDEDTERFYLLSTANDTAALVWHKNISNISTNYDAAYALLPDSSMWQNTNLIAQAESKVTRYMTATEVTNACGGNTNGLKNKSCEYLMEKSNYASTEVTDGIWLEKINNTSNGGRRIQTAGLTLGNVNPSATGSNNAPRPVIEIPLSMLEVWTPTPTNYTITFDPHNENATSPWNETIDVGDDLSEVYPSSDPTYTNHIFQGWYTAASGGTQISSSTIPSSSTTYHAQWKGTVALATVTSNSITVATNGTATVTITNAAELEGFTFSSSDTSVATIDSSTGVITPVAVGTTNISITGSTSNTTNQIVTVTVTQAVVQYTITFDPHNENATSPWNETIDAGDDLSSVYPSSNPTYTNHIFQGWYTAASSGTQISSSTVPSGNTTYHAQWKGTVALATVANNSISVATDGTATVTVTNAADLEGFTFSSSDTSVATIDSSTGVITPLTAGTTNISITGASSNTTNQIVTVTVTEPTPVTYTIYFEPHNGSNSLSVTIVAGNTIGNNNIPADPTNSDPDMIFMGWYTAASGGTLVDGSTTPTADGETYHAQFKKIVCRVETSSANLHTATRASDSTPLTYGYIANNTTPKAGDAYNCDVDYDNTYSAVNERFYYLGTDNTGNSALVAWNSYHDGAWAAGTSNDPIYTYANALTELPANTSGAWDNPGLIEQETGKAARFTKRAEVVSACQGVTVSQAQSLIACDYFMEHTAYDGAGRSALWLMVEDTTHYRIHGGNSNRQVSTSSSGSSMVRPTIVVPYKLIEKYTAPVPADVTNAVIGNSDLTVMVGQTLTVQVSNSASLESYTFSSDDSSIATVDSSTGVVTGVSAGTVDIIMTGTTSGLTKTIEVEVVADPDTPVIFDVSNGATRGYQDLSAQWAQSPVNIATFNKDTTTINNSTWGDISELSELQYWTAIRNNFVSNQCFIQTNTANNTASDAVKPLSALSAWTSGSVDCSKPSAYDTNTNSALTVRLNDAQGAIVAYANAGSGVIHNMIPGQTYYWEKTSDSTVYGYVTAVSNGSSTGTRWVDMDVVRNVRDLGGLPVTYTDSNNQTVTGTLAYGRLFRGEKMQNVSASVLTNLGITTEYNVGDEYSGDTHLSDYHLNNVIHYDFEYHSGDENNASSNYMKAWTAVTNIMTDIVDTNTTKNIYIHCRVGADRTGTVAYILEGLLGVPDEQRYEEYGLTNLSGLYDRTRYYKEKSSSNNLKFVYMMGYLQTTSDILTWYMHNPNANPNLISSFRSAMTTPTQ